MLTIGRKYGSGYKPEEVVCFPARHCAQAMVHAPVNELHLIAAQAVRAADFRLTLRIGGVKRDSFFDTF
jgi:hypothetical protein